MKIKNFKKIAVTKNRKNILKAVEAGFWAIDTAELIKKSFKISKNAVFIKGKEYPINPAGKIFVIGIGKCSLKAVQSLEKIIGNRIAGGAVCDVKPGKLKKIKTFYATHPLPSKQNMVAAGVIVSILKKATAKDTVIMVVSGGGSTMLFMPNKKGCLDEIPLIKSLLRSGATIQEINTIRKHISLARGGFLAKYAYPAKVISLIFSDVTGDDFQFIASGPTAKDETTIYDAKKILSKYNLLFSFDKSLIVETPKEDKYFKNVSNILFVSNKNALFAMKEKLEKMGHKTAIVSFNLQGEAKIVGEEIIKKLHLEKPKTALLYGGETIVMVHGNGKGGRNQELALSALKYVKKGEILIAMASDGRDNTEAAGAICDIITKEKAGKKKLNIGEYLKNNDSYNFFKKTGDSIITGHTDSNVSDFIIAIKE